MDYILELEKGNVYEHMDVMSDDRLHSPTIVLMGGIERIDIMRNIIRIPLPRYIYKIDFNPFAIRALINHNYTQQLVITSSDLLPRWQQKCKTTIITFEEFAKYREPMIACGVQYARIIVDEIDKHMDFIQ